MHFEAKALFIGGPSQ